MYEWDGRAGGRIETLRNYFANGQMTEQHAEFISSEHSATLGMAQRFGLTLENTYADPKGMRDTYWFKGARYDQKALNRDWQDFGWKLFRDAVREAPGARFDRFSHTALQMGPNVGARMDRETRSRRIERRFRQALLHGCHQRIWRAAGEPVGAEPGLSARLQRQHGQWLSVAEASRCSAGSDEKWHIRGGNDQLIDGLVSRIPDGTINFGHQLIALAENADGSFTCTFDRNGSTVEVVADHVVLTMPFTTLRNVSLTGVTISDLKRTAIAGLQLGNNVKIQIQVAGRPWTRDGYTGDTITDAAVNGSWDGTTYQSDGGNADTEILIAVPGGSDGAGLAAKYGLVFGQEQGPAPAALVNDTLAQLEPILPGITAAWSAGPKLAWVNDGNIDEHFLGAWSQYNVGQYTGFCGVERLREGNIHFAGEHTSVQFQGFIEGAVRSGHRAANEI